MEEGVCFSQASICSCKKRCKIYCEQKPPSNYHYARPMLRTAAEDFRLMIRSLMRAQWSEIDPPMHISPEPSSLAAIHAPASVARGLLKHGEAACSRDGNGSGIYF